ncbi:hypothetical protein [uncultured Lacinutrix sp.]|uniref:hypothetical protein n=1 Tax=uncultured Lacinutrix sp. TaxID=574032 RepID=UPI00260246BA|nr:hypothetical protein [uncultured Lacinutrix sp.]
MSILKSIKKKAGKKAKQLKLLRFHAKQTSNKRFDKKRIIICFNGQIPHGGLVDRLKGIVSFYEVAKVLDYNFFIQFNNPFTLNTFLEPNTVQWKIKDEAVTYNSKTTKLVYVINDFNVNPLTLIKESKAETFLVYANIDYLSKMYPEVTGTVLENKWRTSFNELFKKSSLLESKLKSVEKDNYIAFHTRFTTLMGDFQDTTALVLAKDEKDALIFQLQKKIQTLLQGSDNKCYGFSDSIQFLKTIKEKENIHLVEGNPFHMDNFDTNASLEGHLKTILDFFMLSESETVYFLKLGNMYHSSFSKYAAIVGNKPFKTITD